GLRGPTAIEFCQARGRRLPTVSHGPSGVSPGRLAEPGPPRGIDRLRALSWSGFVARGAADEWNVCGGRKGPHDRSSRPVGARSPRGRVWAVSPRYRGPRGFARPSDAGLSTRPTPGGLPGLFRACLRPWIVGGDEPYSAIARKPLLPAQRE